MKAMDTSTHPTNSVDNPVVPYLTSSSKIGVSGFLDLKPENPQIQARYDAMSGSWEGIQASEAAVKHGIFKADSLPVEPQKQTPTTK